MAYSPDTFSASEQPTTAKWNKLWANDASFNDGTGIGAGAVTAANIGDGILTAGKSTTATNVEIRGIDTIFDFVASGLVWTGDAYGSTLLASMTAGVVYIAGKRITVGAVTARAFTASEDTYIDVTSAGVVTYTEVANNAASPALTAGSIRLGIIVTGATNIAAVGSVNQGQENKVLPIASSVAYAVTDSLGNLICPRDPNRKILGYKQIITNASGTAANTVVIGLSAPVIIPTGRKIRVTVWATGLVHTNSITNNYIVIWDGTVGSGTQLSISQTTTPGTSYTNFQSPSAVVTLAGSHTINVGLNAQGATASIVASTTSPAFLLIELA